MAENLKKKPSKGILKASSSFDAPDRAESAKRLRSKETKWDEMNIIATLHPPDKDYGHMKIEEPKTPYNYEKDGSDEETGGLDADMLAKKIQLGASQPPKALVPEEPEDEESEEEEESPEERAHRKMFETKRKRHYNEFHAVKLARQLMEKDEDGDGDEDEEDEAAELEEESQEPASGSGGVQASAGPSRCVDCGGRRNGRGGEQEEDVKEEQEEGKAESETEVGKTLSTTAEMDEGEAGE